MQKLFIFILSIVFSQNLKAQCQATVTGSPNWSSLSWSGCTPNPNTDGSTYTGDITINGLGNGEVLTIDIDLTINGNLILNASGSNPTFQIAPNKTLLITGNLQNNDNNVRYVMQTGSTLQVNGTLSGNNNQIFSGSGTVKGGTLDLGNNTTCGSPCPTIIFSDCCESGDCATTSGFCADNNNPPALPITLVNFGAKKLQKHSIQLNWVTIAELNNDFFTIQKSHNAQEWVEVATIQSKGNHHSKQTYSWVDTEPLSGNNYYRLKQTDTDGSFTFSPVVVVSFLDKGELFIYPNPTKEILNLQNIPQNEEFKVYLFSLIGKKMLERLILSTEAETIKIELPTLPKGIYYLEIQNKQKRQVQKILIQ